MGGIPPPTPPGRVTARGCWGPRRRRATSVRRRRSATAAARGPRGRSRRAARAAGLHLRGEPLEAGANAGVGLAAGCGLDLGRRGAQGRRVAPRLLERAAPALVDEALDPVILRGRHADRDERVHLGAHDAGHVADDAGDLLQLLERAHVLPGQVVEARAGVLPRRFDPLAHGEEAVELLRRQRVPLRALPVDFVHHVVERGLRALHFLDRLDHLRRLAQERRPDERHAHARDGHDTGAPDADLGQGLHARAPFSRVRFLPGSRPSFDTRVETIAGGSSCRMPDPDGLTGAGPSDRVVCCPSGRLAQR